MQSSRKTFLATSPIGLVTDQAHWSKTKSTSPVGLVAGIIHVSESLSASPKNAEHILKNKSFSFGLISTMMSKFYCSFQVIMMVDFVLGPAHTESDIMQMTTDVLQRRVRFEI